MAPKKPNSPGKSPRRSTLGSPFKSPTPGRLARERAAKSPSLSPPRNNGGSNPRRPRQASAPLPLRNNGGRSPRRLRQASAPARSSAARSPGEKELSPLPDYESPPVRAASSPPITPRAQPAGSRLAGLLENPDMVTTPEDLRQTSDTGSIGLGIHNSDNGNSPRSPLFNAINGVLNLFGRGRRTSSEDRQRTPPEDRARANRVYQAERDADNLRWEIIQNAHGPDNLVADVAMYLEDNPGEDGPRNLLARIAQEHGEAASTAEDRFTLRYLEPIEYNSTPRDGSEPDTARLLAQMLTEELDLPGQSFATAFARWEEIVDSVVPLPADAVLPDDVYQPYDYLHRPLRADVLDFLETFGLRMLIRSLERTHPARAEDYLWMVRTINDAIPESYIRSGQEGIAVPQQNNEAISWDVTAILQNMTPVVALEATDRVLPGSRFGWAEEEADVPAAKRLADSQRLGLKVSLDIIRRLNKEGTEGPEWRFAFHVIHRHITTYGLRLLAEHLLSREEAEELRTGLETGRLDTVERRSRMNSEFVTSERIAAWLTDVAVQQSRERRAQENGNGGGGGGGDGDGGDGPDGGNGDEGPGFGGRGGGGDDHPNDGNGDGAEDLGNDQGQDDECAGSPCTVCGHRHLAQRRRIPDDNDDIRAGGGNGPDEYDPGDDHRDRRRSPSPGQTPPRRGARQPQNRHRRLPSDESASVGDRPERGGGRAGTDGANLVGAQAELHRRQEEYWTDNHNRFMRMLQDSDERWEQERAIERQAAVARLPGFEPNEVLQRRIDQLRAALRQARRRQAEQTAKRCREEANREISRLRSLRNEGDQPRLSQLMLEEPRLEQLVRDALTAGRDAAGAEPHGLVLPPLQGQAGPSTWNRQPRPASRNGAAQNNTRRAIDDDDDELYRLTPGVETRRPAQPRVSNPRSPVRAPPADGQDLLNDDGPQPSDEENVNESIEPNDQNDNGNNALQNTEPSDSNSPTQYAKSGSPDQPSLSRSPTQYAKSRSPAQAAATRSPTQNARSGSPDQPSLSRSPTQYAKSRSPALPAATRSPTQNARSPRATPYDGSPPPSSAPAAISQSPNGPAPSWSDLDFPDEGDDPSLIDYNEEDFLDDEDLNLLQEPQRGNGAPSSSASSSTFGDRTPTPPRPAVRRRSSSDDTPPPQMLVPVLPRGTIPEGTWVEPDSSEDSPAENTPAEGSPAEDSFSEDTSSEYGPATASSRGGKKTAAASKKGKSAAKPAAKKQTGGGKRAPKRPSPAPAPAPTPEPPAAAPRRSRRIQALDPVDDEGSPPSSPKRKRGGNGKDQDKGSKRAKK
ncbi:hypothetical protein LTR17_015239 [Elasticomyces elasticus]|nr:hypothetical protein LTR17_015239 [Elasticomyces elasticus]